MTILVTQLTLTFDAESYFSFFLYFVVEPLEEAACTQVGVQ